MVAVRTTVSTSDLRARARALVQQQLTWISIVHRLYRHLSDVCRYLDRLHHRYAVFQVSRLAWKRRRLAIAEDLFHWGSAFMTYSTECEIKTTVA